MKRNVFILALCLLLALTFAACKASAASAAGYYGYDSYYYNDYDYYDDSELTPTQSILICLGIGAVIGIIVVGIMASAMKSAKPQRSAANYVKNGSLHLRSSSDRFLYNTLTRTPRQQNNRN